MYEPNAVVLGGTVIWVVQSFGWYRHLGGTVIWVVQTFGWYRHLGGTVIWVVQTFGWYRHLSGTVIWVVQSFGWYSHFRTERTSVDEDPRGGRPSTSTDYVHIDSVPDLILQNRRLSIREIAEVT